MLSTKSACSKLLRKAFSGSYLRRRNREFLKSYSVNWEPRTCPRYSSENCMYLKMVLTSAGGVNVAKCVVFILISPETAML